MCRHTPAVIYLAGPISGLTPEQAHESRETTEKLFQRLIGCYWAHNTLEFRSPMRNKEYIVENKPINQLHVKTNIDTAKSVMSTPHGIISRDYGDVSSSDLVFVDLRNTTRVSIGTVCEIGWAWQLRKHIVVLMNSGNIHDHAFIRGMTPFVFPARKTRDAALVACSLLNIRTEA